MSLLKRKESYAIKMIAQHFLVTIFIFPFLAHAQNDNKAFGDSIFITNGLTGKIYLLPVNTRALPDFDTMKSAGTIYVDSINIPPRNWSSGFPGLRDRFEWFGIEYTGFFTANKKGEYLLRLLSDDGSKLFIDDSLIINNDGLHGAFSKTEKVKLDGSKHLIKIQYFQGPRYQIALQLFAKVDGSKEEIFPGDNFTLYTQNPPDNKLHYFLTGVGLIIIYFIFMFWRKSRKRNLEAIK